MHFHASERIALFIDGANLYLITQPDPYFDATS